MKEKSFAEQFSACERILQELLRTEFKAIKEPVRLLVGRIEDGIAQTYPYGTIGHERVIILSLNNWRDTTSKYYGDNSGLSYDSIKADIRHELLHLLSKAGDEDPAFISEAEKRGIELKGSIERYPSYLKSPKREAEAITRVINRKREEVIENLRAKQERIMQEKDSQYTQIETIKLKRGNLFLSGKPRMVEDRYIVPAGSFVFILDTSKTISVSGQYTKRAEFTSRVNELIGIINNEENNAKKEIDGNKAI